MEASHCSEVSGQAFAVSLLQLLDQELYISRDCFFRGLLFLRRVDDDGGGVPVAVGWGVDGGMVGGFRWLLHR